MLALIVIFKTAEEVIGLILILIEAMKIVMIYHVFIVPRIEVDFQVMSASDGSLCYSTSIDSFLKRFLV